MAAKRKQVTRADLNRLFFTRWLSLLLVANEAAGLRKYPTAPPFASFYVFRIKPPLRHRTASAARPPHSPRSLLSASRCRLGRLGTRWYGIGRRFQGSSGAARSSIEGDFSPHSEGFTRGEDSARDSDGGPTLSVLAGHVSGIGSHHNELQQRSGRP